MRLLQYEVTPGFIRGQISKGTGANGLSRNQETGSHIRLSCDKPSQHHITIPNHDTLKLGTLAGILADIALHRRITRDELVQLLFGK